MSPRLLPAIALAALISGLAAGHAKPANAQAATSDSDRLLIVNGNTGHVIYDDGRDDLFCVTRTVVVGHTDWGYPIRKRVMHCR